MTPRRKKRTKEGQPRMKNHVTRKGRLLGGWVPPGLVQGVRDWIKSGPERDISTFLREAAREKLRRENVFFSETETTGN
jgi:hypothetical protein